MTKNKHPLPQAYTDILSVNLKQAGQRLRRLKDYLKSCPRLVDIVLIQDPPQATNFQLSSLASYYSGKEYGPRMLLDK